MEDLIAIFEATLDNVKKGTVVVFGVQFTKDETHYLRMNRYKIVEIIIKKCKDYEEFKRRVLSNNHNEIECSALCKLCDALHTQH